MTAPSPVPRRAASLAGTGALVRFLLRRDRIKLPAWVGGLGLFVIYIGAALPALAPTESELASVTTLFTQPVGRLFTGPAFGMTAPTYARFFAAGYAQYLFLLAGLMNIMLVTRHTRVEEQTGRAEMLRANVIGQYAALTASLLVAAITNSLAALVVAALAVGAGFPVTGSVLVGAGTGLTGMAFAGIAAVTAQLSEFSRTAAGMAGAVLGAAFVLRALGDMAAVGGSALSWLSPLGWPAQAAPYVFDRWAPLLLSIALAAATMIIAFLLQGRRDFGAGLIAARRGRAQARPILGTSFGLAARLQRGGVLGWGAGIVLLGIAEGAFAQALVDAGESMPAALQEIFGRGGLVTGYLSFLGSFVAVLVAAYTVFAMLTLRTEEARGRADLVLATPTSRIAWLGSHVTAVAAGVVTIALVAGLGTGAAAAAVTGDWGLLGDGVVAHLGPVPAMLLLLSCWVVLIGWAPRLLAPMGWAIIAIIGLITLFADLLRLPRWLIRLSPFEHLSRLPGEFAIGPFLSLLGLAALVTVVGLVGISRRQISTV